VYNTTVIKIKDTNVSKVERFTGVPLSPENFWRKPIIACLAADPIISSR